jgi:hypothetical protein
MSATATAGALKRAPFYDIQVAIGAKIVHFAGDEMPVTYPMGLLAEHKAVREPSIVNDRGTRTCYLPTPRRKRAPRSTSRSAASAPKCGVKMPFYTNASHL